MNRFKCVKWFIIRSCFCADGYLGLNFKFASQGYDPPPILFISLDVFVTILLLSSSSPWTCLFQLDVKICTQLTEHTKHVSQKKYVLFCQSLMSKQHISISYLHTSIPWKSHVFVTHILIIWQRSTLSAIIGARFGIII